MHDERAQNRETLLLDQNLLLAYVTSEQWYIFENRTVRV